MNIAFIKLKNGDELVGDVTISSKCEEADAHACDAEQFWNSVHKRDFRGRLPTEISALERNGI